MPSTEEAPLANPQSSIRNPQCLYQILNGHHRAEVLRQLGHSHARCDVWEVDDEEARLLLATLNRLEGRDDPAARAKLVSHLAEMWPPGDLADLLPEPPDAIERLLVLARPPVAPLPPEEVEPPLRPMTFFVDAEQHALVTEALGEITKCGMRSADCGMKNDTVADDSAAEHTEVPFSRRAGAARVSRGEALERLAQWYLEFRRRR
jgi:hypothetical protein